MAPMRGRTVRERTQNCASTAERPKGASRRNFIAVAHPDHRGELGEAARKLGYL